MNQRDRALHAVVVHAFALLSVVVSIPECHQRNRSAARQHPGRNRAGILSSQAIAASSPREPTIAAVGSFAALLVIWLLKMPASFDSAFAPLFDYLSLISHYQDLISGLFDSSDVVYYLLFRVAIRRFRLATPGREPVEDIPGEHEIVGPLGMRCKGVQRFRPILWRGGGDEGVLPCGVGGGPGTSAGSAAGSEGAGGSDVSLRNIG